MAIEKIIYRAATSNMGDVTEQDGDNYRAWAKAQIEAKYPKANVEALDEDMKSEVIVSGCTSRDESLDEWEAAHEFLRELWDSCPWTGEHFE